MKTVLLSLPRFTVRVLIATRASNRIENGGALKPGIVIGRNIGLPPFPLSTISAKLQNDLRTPNAACLHTLAYYHAHVQRSPRHPFFFFNFHFFLVRSPAHVEVKLQSTAGDNFITVLYLSVLLSGGERKGE